MTKLASPLLVASETAAAAVMAAVAAEMSRLLVRAVASDGSTMVLVPLLNSRTLEAAPGADCDLQMGKQTNAQKYNEQ